METKKNIGIWIRVSTEMQVKGESPEHHEKRARLYAEAKGWDIIEVYRLEAISGKSVMEQTETKRMLKDVKAGRISGLIFSKLARLARNTKELLEFAEIFKECNCDLISLAESIDTSTPAGRLFYTMIAAMATWEREEIAERVAASVPIRAKLGKPLSAQTSLGYRWVNKEFVIDEKEAAVRKLMYEIFLKTKRKKATAKELNDLGYRTRTGAKFGHTTVARLLQDTTAKGIRKANYTTGKNGRGIKPEEEWVYTSCPAIVSEELWNQCNAIINEQLSKTKKPGPRGIHLLSGFVTCSCGKKMYVYHKDKSPHYRCKLCNTKIEVADLDQIYHEQLKVFLLTETDVADYMNQSDSRLQEKEQLLISTQSDIEKKRKQIKELVELRLKGELNSETLAPLLKPLEIQVKQLEEQLPELEAEVDFLKIEYLSSETVLSGAKDLYNNWASMPFEEKRNVVELITNNLIVGKGDISISLSYLPTPHLPQKAGKSDRKEFLAVPFSELNITVLLPDKRPFPCELQTVGNHIKHARLSRNMLIKDVITLLKIDRETLRGWELNLFEPHVSHYPLIISFLGYNPCNFETNTFGGKIKAYRYKHGLTQKQFGKLLDCDCSVIWQWESNSRLPISKTQEKLVALFEKG